MKQYLFRALIGTISGYVVLQNSGCTHEPVLVDPFDPIGNAVDTMPIDPTPFVPCEEGVVYFGYDVLPILISNCSVPTCHDDVSHQDGLILTSYEKVMSSGKVEPFDPGDSDLFEVITEDDEEKRMPRLPQLPLTQEQIQVIATWILQGAQNLTCDLETTCNTENVSFAQMVNPIITTNCRGCHSGQNPSGGVFLGDYTGIRTEALSGRLYGVIARLQGYIPMPKNRGPLQDCEITQIKAWIDAGALEN
ncbi:MAG TPA: c-type cytochrome domain-containing protein [Saprospiraceae bacterium]|nr:c-type cytochrome domain-containing protein [Saprospiraceae bacterium]